MKDASDEIVRDDEDDSGKALDALGAGVRRVCVIVVKQELIEVVILIYTP